MVFEWLNRFIKNGGLCVVFLGKTLYSHTASLNPQADVQILDGMLVHRRVTPSIKFAGTHLYTWVERGTVGVKCLAQYHKTMSLART